MDEVVKDLKVLVRIGEQLRKKTDLVTSICIYIHMIMEHTHYMPKNLLTLQEIFFD